jgi:hypothetical protein
MWVGEALILVDKPAEAIATHDRALGGHWFEMEPIRGSTKTEPSVRALSVFIP